MDKDKPTEQPKLMCPMSIKHNFNNYEWQWIDCSKQYCAWWDSRRKRCGVFTNFSSREI